MPPSPSTGTRSASTSTTTRPTSTARRSLTKPRGSGCSIVVGDLPAQRAMEPGSLHGMQLVVADAEAARAELVGRGVECSEIQVIDPRDGGTFFGFSDSTATRGSSRSSRCAPTGRSSRTRRADASARTSSTERRPSRPSAPNDAFGRECSALPLSSRPERGVRVRNAHPADLPTPGSAGTRPDGILTIMSNVPQQRLLQTAIPGPKSAALQARKTAAVSAGVSTGLPV